MSNAMMKADEEVLGILRQATVDDTGLTLNTQLDRKQYVAVNKFLSVIGANWNRGKGRHIFDGPASKEKLLTLLGDGQILNEKKHFQSFYSPENVASRVIELAEIEKGMTVLEPSAGEGALACLAREAGALVKVMEINPAAAEVLTKKCFKPLLTDFLLETVDPIYDRVVMNPPFTSGQDVRHILFAFKFLKPGGILVAIRSTGLGGVKSHERREFSTLVQESMIYVEAIPAGAFSESGTDIATQIIVFKK